MMITSSKQLNASNEAANDLRKMILAETDIDLPSVLVEANNKRLRRKLAKIEDDIEEYKASIALDPSTLRFNQFEDLLKAPIIYRLASHESVKGFAQRIGIDQRQILRYESETYQNCSVPNLFKILGHIGVKITGEITGEVTAKSKSSEG